jgi:hypothetical protein
MLQPLGLQFIAAYLLNIVAKLAQKIGLQLDIVPLVVS